MLPLRTLAARLRAREFTTAQAAAITDIPLTKINHYISRELGSLGVAVWGDGKRSLSYDGLVALRMAHDYPKSLAPTARCEVISKALKSPRKKHVVLENGKVIVPVATSRRLVSEGLHRLRQAEALVAVDRGTLGGEPCFKGTRIPVYSVAAIAKTEGIDETKATYSKLTKAQITSACVYAKANPRRGRPKRVGDILSKRKAKSSKTFSVVVD